MLGDIGNLDTLEELLNNLNFKKLIIVTGNYERKELEKFKKIIDKFDNVFIENNGFYLSCKNKDKQTINFFVCHEPITELYNKAKEFYKDDDFITLFGHIHGRSFAKRNGFDIGTDYHRYTPISIDDVMWFVNAMQYWDENVYTDKVKAPNTIKSLKDRINDRLSK